MGPNEAAWNSLPTDSGEADSALRKALNDYPYKLDGFADQEWEDVYGMALANYRGNGS